MKFYLSLFVIICLYALVQAKGETSQKKESPLRKILTTTTTTTTTTARPVPQPTIRKRVSQRVQPVKRPLNVIKFTQGPIVIRPTQAPIRVVPQEPTEVKQLVQENYEQITDNSEEDIQQELEIPAKGQVSVEQPKPTYTRRKFNVLLRTMDGFHEKQGYSIN